LNNFCDCGPGITPRILGAFGSSGKGGVGVDGTLVENRRIDKNFVDLNISLFIRYKKNIP
jgi:hypothetical protein